MGIGVSNNGKNPKIKGGRRMKCLICGEHSLELIFDLDSNYEYFACANLICGWREDE